MQWVDLHLLLTAGFKNCGLEKGGWRWEWGLGVGGCRGGMGGSLDGLVYTELSTAGLHNCGLEKLMGFSDGLICIELHVSTAGFENWS